MARRLQCRFDVNSCVKNSVRGAVKSGVRGAVKSGVLDAVKNGVLDAVNGVVNYGVSKSGQTFGALVAFAMALYVSRVYEFVYYPYIICDGALYSCSYTIGHQNSRWTWRQR